MTRRFLASPGSPDVNGVDVSMLLADPERTAEVPVELIPGLLCRLSAVQSALAARLGAHPLGKDSNAPNGTDRLLRADEVAARTGLSRDYIYRHADAFPFTRRVGRRAVRFSEQGLDRWLRTRRKG